MKTARFFVLIALVFSVWSVRGQGVFTYDQQSSTNETFVPGGGSIQGLAPYGQSFTPLASSMNFIRLGVLDQNPNNGLGGTLHLNLRSDTIGGSILATTPSLSFADGYSSFAYFFFSADIPLNSGNLYVFEIVAEPGSDAWRASAGEYSYPGGMVFAGGAPASGSDFWFREGTHTVPEPSVLSMFGLGALLLGWRWRSLASGHARHSAP